MKNLENDFSIQKLLLKFQRLDVFSKREEVALMVGGVALPGYQDERLLALFDEIDQYKKEGSFQKIIETGDQCLAIFPLCAKALAANMDAYYELGDKEKSDHYYSQLSIVFSAMQASGSANNMDKPYIAHSTSAIQTYSDIYTGGMLSRVAESKLDDWGNQVLSYKVFGKEDYFIIPKAN